MSPDASGTAGNDVGLVDLWAALCSQSVDGQSMVDRRGAEHFFARVWSQVKSDFGFGRQPDSLEVLNERLRRAGYRPFTRCVVVGLGFAAFYVIFCLFFCTVEGKNLANLLLLGGVLHQFVIRRQRGAPVLWASFLVAAGVPAIYLFAPRGAAPADEKVKDVYKACVNAAKEWCDTYEKCRDAWEACGPASR